ncbi:nicotinamide-nucleotide amidohydrolase family protein [Saccharophagus sp. K07]|jgi:nicotinamide-nucleotide amidase|uniref:CinA family protein n=1 Tax=Saccharophagus sp. K07 TaxID=2283636 RepID=UPI0016525063|nr:nicotinamide-nucleotide amidohydrolase family protein [Saccharophagus sp. K07]MBC6905684.1 nicotinamide-nucleotide amidohydrolase family protein [Saccharophagus sp. K07]
MNELNSFQLATRLGELLLTLGAKVATAESCTGGGIAHAITEVPGSSQWFDYGFVTYSNQAKHELLGVDESLLSQYGAVSERVVRAMVKGAMAKASAQFAVAVSGIAGPGGGSAAKPVGTVWLAWGHPEGVLAERHQFAGDRHAVREQAVNVALKRLVELGERYCIKTQ